MKSEDIPHFFSGQRMSKEWKAIYHAIRLNIPFAAYQLPGEKGKKINFIAQMPGAKPISSKRFIINMWNEPASHSIHIKDTVSVEDFLKGIPTEPVTQPLITPYPHSTSSLLYKGQVMSIKEDLKEYDASDCVKTVLSRTVTGEIPGEDIIAVWIDIISQYFKELPGTFRYVYYSPDTAFWVGASPEILLEVNKETGQSRTMSLAGTKFIRSSSWDEKNCNEHDIVTRFLMMQLENLGIKYQTFKTNDVKFTHFTHLCDMLNFNITGHEIDTVIDAINPTPALSGFPVSDAIDRLSHIELHDRYCYGGYVGIESDSEFMAYVNIRCMHFYGKDYCRYLGSGILVESNPEKEWRETAEKGALLSGIINLMAYYCH